MKFTCPLCKTPDITLLTVRGTRIVAHHQYVVPLPIRGVQLHCKLDCTLGGSEALLNTEDPP